MICSCSLALASGSGAGDGACGGAVPAADTSESCGSWALQGECVSDAKHMLASCATSCSDEAGKAEAEEAAAKGKEEIAAAVAKGSEFDRTFAANDKAAKETLNHNPNPVILTLTLTLTLT